ncbi:MAG TPA: hypothetical protein ENJ82_05475, partial [Bacteroidetes bacterium]|nr:hypothetical protein [Bacteroidota bacterium]
MIRPYLQHIDRWLIPFIFLLGVYVSFSSHTDKLMRGVLMSDGEGYYMYLPAVFIYGDWHRFSKETGDGLPMLMCCSLSKEKVVQTRYTYGISVLQSPFFLVAHAYATTFLGKGTSPPAGYDVVEQHPLHQQMNHRRWTELRGQATGFSDVYARSILISGMFYLCLGLWLMKETLKRWFSIPVSLLTTVTIFFATNLFYYATQESSMSHVYSFFLFAAFLFLLPRFLQRSSGKTNLLIGLVLALILLIRPSNLIMVLLFFGFEVYSWAALKARTGQLLRRYKDILLMVFLVILVVIPQLWFWKQTFGTWLTYSYGKEGFSNWNRPEILKVLFSYQNGLFLYTPVMLLAMVGVVMAWRKKAMSAPVILAVFAFATYTFASWWAWWFGGAFGHRCYVEYYALLAWPLAWVIRWAWDNPRRVVRLSLVALLFIFSYANLKM